MPFTFCHAAIVLPLNYLPKRFVSLSALIIGSFLPDFEYFVRMDIKSEHAHSLSGVWYFCLPLGVLLYVVFHQVVKKPLVVNLPAFLQKRFIQDATTKSYFGKHGVVLVLSLVLGAYSHIFWDAFTHQGGFFVERIAFLSDTTFFSVPAYKLAQHGSSLFGGLFILFWIWKMPIQERPTYAINWTYWFEIIACTLILFCVRVLFLAIYKLGTLIVSGISCSILALVLVSVMYDLKKGN